MDILKLHFNLKNNTFPINYNSAIVSFIKQCVDDYCHALYEGLYGENVLKSYTFNVFLPGAKFKTDKIELSKKNINIFFSSYYMNELTLFYTIFMKAINKKIYIKDNVIFLDNVQKIVKQNIKNDYCLIKFVSPLMVREHDKEKNQDKYLIYSDYNFEKKIKDSVYCAIEKMELQIPSKNFSILPIEPKKIVVRHFDIMANANIGLYLLKGDKKCLNFVYAKGLGSHTSSGHGMFNVIN